MSKSCFVCGRPATSMDHVPPRSFFPKEKDLPAGTAGRRNLITVPACDEHNGRCSKDDEVAAYVILLTHKANQLGTDQFLRKGIRAVTGRRGLIGSIFKSDIEVHQLPGGREAATFEFDAERVERVMERIARGLFFHEFARRWECRLSLISDGPLMPDFSNPYRDMFQRLDPLFNQAPRKGANPAAFWYDWLLGTQGDRSHMLRMCFYDGLRFIAFPDNPTEDVPQENSRLSS